MYPNPIFEAHANHRYNTSQLPKADPLLGTNEGVQRPLRRRCQRGHPHHSRRRVQPHRLGLGLLQPRGRYGPGGAYRRDRSSPYRSWYDFDSGYPCGYRSWWGFETLPEVQEDSPLLWILSAARAASLTPWLGLGASGFRLDVADELP